MLRNFPELPVFASIFLVKLFSYFSSFTFALVKHYMVCHGDEVSSFAERKTGFYQIRLANFSWADINRNFLSSGKFLFLLNLL